MIEREYYLCDKILYKIYKLLTFYFLIKLLLLFYFFILTNLMGEIEGF